MAPDKKTKAMEKQAKKDAKKAKQATKTEKKAMKQERKELDLEDEEDINVVVKRLSSKSDSIIPPPLNGQLVACPQPSPRVHFSMLPTGSGDLVMFGGQCYDGANQAVFQDTYRWNFETNEWRKLVTEIQGVVAPPPRSAHQAVIHSNKMYIFGGEYSTLRQFYHHRDLWRYDLKTNVWTQIKASGLPPTQRSGHRMIVWKGYIVVFGGFYDTFRDSKYFNDLHMFNVAEERWEKVEIATGVLNNVPSPRGGCCFFLNPTETGNTGNAYVYGGYVRNGKMSGEELTDMWLLNLRAPPQKSSWERISRKGTAPSKRSGLSFTVHKNRAILFGGVFDREKPGLSLDSHFFNEMYAFDMTRKKWYILDYQAVKSVRQRRQKAKAVKNGNDSDYDVSDDPDEEGGSNERSVENNDGQRVLKKFEWLFEYVDEHGKTQHMIVNEEEDAENAETPTDQDDQASTACPTPELTAEAVADFSAPAVVSSIESKIDAKPEVLPPTESTLSSEEFELPSERISACLLVRNNQLVLYGGMAEVGDREITYDDCWVLDLRVRDKWNKKIEGTMHLQKWLGDEESEDDSEFDDCASSVFDSCTDSSDSDDSSDSNDDSDHEGDHSGLKTTTQTQPTKSEPVKQKSQVYTPPTLISLDDLKIKKKSKKDKVVVEDVDDKAGVEEAPRLVEVSEAVEVPESNKPEAETAELPQKEKKAKRTLKEKMSEYQQKHDLADESRTPLLNENLKEFHSRTKDHWNNLALQALTAEDDVKDHKKRGFALAQERFDALKPLLDKLRAMEEEQKEQEAEKKHKKGKR